MLYYRGGGGSTSYTRSVKQSENLHMHPIGTFPESIVLQRLKNSRSVRSNYRLRFAPHFIGRMHARSGTRAGNSPVDQRPVKSLNGRIARTFERTHCTDAISAGGRSNESAFGHRRIRILNPFRRRRRPRPLLVPGGATRHVIDPS